MLHDGLYEMHYRSESTPGSGYDSLHLILREGRLLGSDQWGGVLLGRRVFDPGADRHKFSFNFKIPPGGMLVTDDAPREQGDIVRIELDVAQIEDMSSHGSGIVDVAGHPVWIELAFRGPVPF